MDGGTSKMVVLDFSHECDELPQRPLENSLYRDGVESLGQISEKPRQDLHQNSEVVEKQKKCAVKLSVMDRFLGDLEALGTKTRWKPSYSEL